MTSVNLHHLELFHYVVRAGGINRACRIIPYGIQQPAISSQIIKLEQSLGTRLFQRKPFRLTPAGQRLSEYLQPFFDGLNQMEAIIAGTVAPRIRLVGPGEFFKHHLPDLLRTLGQEFPGLTTQVYERHHAESIALLERDEVDLAITVIESFLPPGLQHREIVRLPLVLLVGPAFRKVREAEKFWSGRMQAPLISLPKGELLTRLFTDELMRRKGNWPTSLEASNVDLVAHYVSQNMGVGLSVKLPGKTWPPGIRALPLEGFPELVIGVFWRGTLVSQGKRFLELITERAGKI